ncbi:hypothetical protein BCV71DRAFT_267884 [Rhizopus microsporus]|uniref:Uncharacterized protein n=1 Tax=Rhizopus microsporus TaxID=58291 RepID=A0A1X0RPH7_RHIZD|nr:hypothetical protein BCV71DRAFT_267884 [Rhizopus microsporus]
MEFNPQDSEKDKRRQSQGSSVDHAVVANTVLVKLTSEDETTEDTDTNEDQSIRKKKHIKHTITDGEIKKDPKVDNGFKKLILSTKTVVEDKLYGFGKTCVFNHPSQSSILDLNELDIYLKKRNVHTTRNRRN